MGNGVAGLQKHDLDRKWREPRIRSGFEFDGHGEGSMVDFSVLNGDMSKEVD